MNLVDATDRLGQGDLEAQVDPSGPRELALVGSAFNDLTGRVRSLMNREREAAADLSHRLRTPLTALRLDVEAVGKSIDATRLQRDVEELERVVGHVISEARRGVRGGGQATADLAQVVAERAAFWGNLADDQGRTWTMEIEPGRFQVSGDATELEAMLDAILGNVFSHTQPGAGYHIGLRRSSGGIASLTIVDDGPGIKHDALLERGASGGDSTGLGVDIIRATAAAAGGSAEWSSNPSGGTSVRVVLPLSHVSR
jgi:signal transduction histidine kinase